MARLDPLVRFRRHQVDEKRRTLARLYRELDVLQQKKIEILEHITHEQVLVDKNPDPVAKGDLARFTAAMHDRIKGLEADMTKMDVMIAMAQDDMREAFENMKKVEIVARERDKKEQKKIDDLEAAELNEIGLDQHRRKDK